MPDTRQERIDRIKTGLVSPVLAERVKAVESLCDTENAGLITFTEAEEIMDWRENIALFSPNHENGGPTNMSGE